VHFFLAQAAQATATPYAVQPRPMGQTVQIGIGLAMFGILCLISLPLLVLIWRRIFHEKD
jgi:hypothetical protein